MKRDMHIRITLKILFSLVLVALFAASATADSLWQPCSISLFGDHKARRPGDVLTIVIVEASSAKHVAKRDSAKEFDSEAGAGTGIFDFIRSFSLSAERSSAGSGSSTQTTNLIDRLSVTVTAVEPNGVLHFSGQRNVFLHADEVTLSISGKVRYQDISPVNTVMSSAVADLKIVVDGTGPTADTQKPGLIYRILRLLW